MKARVLVALALLHGLVGWLFLADAGPGFPIDDAWIHMVYARSLGAGQGFAYNPGQLETGVTAPLWTALLALPVSLADALGQRPDAGVRVLGGLFGLALAWCGFRLGSQAGRWPAVFCALALSLDPLLCFDRFSGMEQALFGLLTLLLLEASLDGREGRVGLLSGALVLTRPEGLVLVALAGWRLLRQRRRMLRFLVPLLLLLLPWLAWCQLVSGHPWPATMANKAELVDPASIWHACAALLRNTGWGWGLPLLVLVGAFSLEGGRHGLGTLLVVAAALLLGGVLVTRRLEVGGEPPRVPYYWARYATLAWPLLVMLAATGLAALVRTAYAGLLCRPLYASILIGPLVVVLALAWEMPRHVLEVSRRFAAECANTEALNVAAGRWIARHLPPDALVATHDAGAIRFFGERRVLDIWGNHDLELLEVQQRGPAATVAWLQARAPDALVVLPALYAPDHAPELGEMFRELPPAEGLRLKQLLGGVDDYASLFGLTRRAATFRVKEAATIPSPLHETLAVFLRP